jgi:hypothetical protein
VPTLPQTNGWTRVPIASVEDLSDVVQGAGLETTQMSRAPVSSLIGEPLEKSIGWSGMLGVSQHR